MPLFVFLRKVFRFSAPSCTLYVQQQQLYRNLLPNIFFIHAISLHQLRVFMFRKLPNFLLIPLEMFSADKQKLESPPLPCGKWKGGCLLLDTSPSSSTVIFPINNFEISGICKGSKSSKELSSCWSRINPISRLHIQTNMWSKRSHRRRYSFVKSFIKFLRATEKKSVMEKQSRVRVPTHTIFPLLLNIIKILKSVRDFFSP